MDVWMTHVRRAGKCGFCPSELGQLEPCVVTRQRNSRDGQVYTRVVRYHPQCWISQGLIYLEKHPLILNYGRRRLDLSKEDRSRRLQLLRRRSQLMYYAREAADAKRWWTAANNFLKADALIGEIEKVGGVPKSWLPKEVKDATAATTK
jgi:hypothetical protein